MSRRLLPAVGVLAVLLAATACAPSGDDLVVLTASSLVDVTDALAADWGGGAVLVSDAGSQVLAAQVRAGADADVLLLADPAVAAALHEEGHASAPVAVATNGLAIVVAADAEVTSLADLARPDLRVVLADETVPLGAYTREGLARAEELGLLPVGGAAEVVGNADSLEDAARVVLAKVTAGEADAAIVYATDAATVDGGAHVIAWPAGADVTASYTVQLVDGARPEAAALADHLASSAAATTWERFGFAPTATMP